MPVPQPMLPSRTFFTFEVRTLFIISRLQGAAAYLTSTQAWMSITTLIKVIHLDPPSFPVCLDTITWCANVPLRNGVNAEEDTANRFTRSFSAWLLDWG